jgi:sugar lactone lactonase YvrE
MPPHSGRDEASFDPVVENVFFPESPRWHGEELWFSDIYGRAVARHADGVTSVVARLTDANPSGLGWLPDGRLLVSAMQSQRLMATGPDATLVELADLTAVARGMPNDMAVTDEGFAFVGDGGYPVTGDYRLAQRRPGQMLRVTADGAIAQVADDLAAPNGIAFDPRDRTLIVAETHAARLSAFAVSGDGSLSSRRVFAELRPASGSGTVPRPDGLCLDEAGAVWVADTAGRRVIRVRPGGLVTDSFAFADCAPVACVLGGPERRILYVCTVPEMAPERIRRAPQGRILAAPVAVPGVGTP